MSDKRVRDLSLRYDAGAQAYETSWAPILEPLSAGLLKNLAGPATRVLEVGAGTCALFPRLKRTFPDAGIVGIDRSPGMLARASADLPRAVMDASHLGFLSHSFDVVTMMFMLFHLPDPVRGLREARRVLKPDGRIGTVTWGSEVDIAAGLVWNEILDDHGADPLDPDTDLAQHELMDTPSKVEGLMASAGLTAIRVGSREYEYTLDADHLIALRTRLGRSKPRFDSLSAAQQKSCLDTAWTRLAGLPGDDFVARGLVVYATAMAP